MRWRILNRYRGSPTGSLRVTAPRAVAHAILAPLLTQMTAANPGLSLEVSCDDRLVDIVAEGYDAGIRFGRSLQPDMIAVRLKFSFLFVVVGSPAYFRERGFPQTPKDLLSQNCIRYRLANGVVFPWEFERSGETFSVPVTGQITLDDQRMMLETALSGGGLALVFTHLAQEHLDSGKLVRCLESWESSIGELFLYYSSRHHVSATLRSLIDALR